MHRCSTFFCTPCSLASWPKLLLMAAKDGTTVVDEVARQVSYVYVEMCCWSTFLHEVSNFREKDENIDRNDKWSKDMYS